MPLVCCQTIWRVPDSISSPLSQQGFHRFHSKAFTAFTARLSPQGFHRFHRKAFTARLSPQGFHRKAFTARLAPQGFLQQG
jgi:hypothetical protein